MTGEFLMAPGRKKIIENNGFQISDDIDVNIKYFNGKLHANESFDIIYRVLEIAQRRACLYCVDGLNKDEILEKILEYFFKLKPEDIPLYGHELSKKLIPYGEVGIIHSSQEVIDTIMSGITVLFIDGVDVAFSIDCRSYPARSVEEPEKDRVMRGPRDGFVETLVFNTALIRRRIRDPELIIEMFKGGDSSRTDIAVCYMDNRVDKKFLNDVKRRIRNVKVDSLTMGQESLAEMLFRGKWINPFPKFKYTERPDTTAACLLEGNIVVIVDNSPSAMILPVSVFDIIEEADDYYFPPITGTYLRLSRFLINILTVLVTPTWLLFINNPQFMPHWLEFTMVEGVINIPLIFQFLILEFAIDGMRLAALNTPNMLSTPLSVIAALVVGDFAASSGWFNPEPMLYMAFVAIANYAQVSFELGYALKFMRLILLIATAIFNVWGYVAGVVFIIVCICANKTISGTSYIYPLIPFNLKELAKRFLRINLRNTQ